MLRVYIAWFVYAMYPTNGNNSLKKKDKKEKNYTYIEKQIVTCGHESRAVIWASSSPLIHSFINKDLHGTRLKKERTAGYLLQKSSQYYRW